MAVTDNLEKVAAILYRREIITEEQYGKLRVRREGKGSGRLRPSAKQARKPQSAIEEIEAHRLTTADKKPLDEEKIMRAIAQEYALPFLKIDPLKLDADIVTGLLPEAFAMKRKVLPLYRTEDLLTVAVADPEDVDAVEQIKMVTGLEVERVVSCRTDIERTVRQFYGFSTTVRKAERDVGDALANIGNLEQLSHMTSEEEISSSDRHIQGSVDFILRNALAQRASDIHIEPKRDKTIVRLRIDGVLQATQKMPPAVHNAVVSRIKLLSRMDISEKRRPQDGRIKIRDEDSDDGREVEMRVSVLPVTFGEKVVIRIFDVEMGQRDLDGLGFYPEEMERYMRFLSRPHGIILVTGPTGSGKTSTLYASLRRVFTPEKNIVTLEDPVEIVVPDYNQVAVQPGIDLTFASALRSILRQDPDIIMIGEIRDRETAQNATQAALTGHLVLSTLHTNDTASSLTRLFDLGVEPYLVKSSIIGIVAQRLVRVICGDCRVKTRLTPEMTEAFGLDPSVPMKIRKGKGCPKCRFTGFYGRNGVHEVMEITEAVRRQVDANAPANVIMQAAIADGMRTLRENGIRKVTEGITTPEEIMRVFAGV